MKKNIDVLLIARPDHSIQIYKALCTQRKLSFYYITFKVVHAFVKYIFPYKKLQTVTKRCCIDIRATIIQVFKKTFNFKFAQNWQTDNMLSNTSKDFLKKNNIKIVHYWPEYASRTMNEYILKNTKTIVLADMYMPNPIAILNEMKPIYQKYGLDNGTNNWLYEYAEKMEEHFASVKNIVVASTYVRDTMKLSFPDKNYIIVPYGITISPTYTKKRELKKSKKFIYIGRVSIEKGCDILLSIFRRNPEYELHIYGGIWQQQRKIFEPYFSYGNIYYHGTVSKEDLRKEIVKCDVGIHLSRFDAYSLAVGEIIGCGVPVIVSETTGIKDEVRNNGFGLVTNLDFNEIENSIEKMSDLKFYSQCIDNIDKYIKSNPKSFGEKMVDEYKKLLE